MYPVLFTIPLMGGLKLHSYGLMVALGFLVGIFWVGREAKRVGMPADKLMDLAFYIIVSAIVGSRLLYVLIEDPQILWTQPLDFFKVWEGGLVFYGGLIGAVATSAWYMKRHQLNFWKVADIFMPGVAIGHAIGRLGCFAAGCCYGRPVDHPAWWAVIYPTEGEGLAPGGTPLFPTQLMESGAELAIFLILVYYSRKKKFDGQILLMYLILYSIIRIVLEFFRGDFVRGFIVGGVSTSQFVSIFLILAAIGCWIFRSRATSLSKS